MSNEPQRIVLEFVELLPGKNDAKLFDLYESEQAFHEHKAALQEAERARVAAIMPAPRPKPTRCAAVLSPTERAAMREDSSLCSMYADEPSCSEVCQASWLRCEPSFFVSALFESEDRIEVSLEGSRLVRPLLELRKDLSAYWRISPNALVLDAEPARRYFVARFPCSRNIDAAWKRVSFLSRSAELVMATHCAADAALEAWYNVRSFSPEKLRGLAVLYLQLGGDSRALHSDWLAAMPGSLCHNAQDATYQQLHGLGYLATPEQMKPRNAVIHFRAPKGTEQK